MLPTPPQFRPRCDCCGLVINPHVGDMCSRCGYPTNLSKEERFLEESVQNLQRVIQYGGAQATVAQLLQRYRTRLGMVRQIHAAPQQVGQNAAPLAQNRPFPPYTPVQPSTMMRPPTTPVEPVAVVSQVPVAPQHMFSLRSFFADQTINIVSSLGAFLILIGSLSFVVTTTNLFLAFLVVFFVHSIFATVGFVFSRFPSFRFIARVYTGIFALLVPLVGFSGYRLVSGNFVQVAAPTVVAIAAVYAALVYGLLAITQQFKLFGYLAAAALVLSVLSSALALHLNYWWWPILLMPLAFAGLFFARPASRRVLPENSIVLQEPIRMLMYACIATVGLSTLSVYIYCWFLDIARLSSFDVRLAGAVLLCALLCWTCGYLLVTTRLTVTALLPYQLVGIVAAFAYTFQASPLTYGVLFSILALGYRVLILATHRSLPRFYDLRVHIEVVAFVLLGLVPLIVAPFALINLLHAAYTPAYSASLVADNNTIPALLLILLGCAVTVSITFSRTGLLRLPAPSTGCWLLLLSAGLFTWAYSMGVLALHLAPVYAVLALVLVLLACTIAVRRFVSVAWSNPLDVVVLGEVALLLLLSVWHDPDVNLALLLLCAVLSYAAVTYQQRRIWLFLPLVFLFFAFPLLLERPRLMLTIGIALPLAAIVVARNGQPFTIGTGPTARHLATLGWEWPLLVAGLFYGAAVCSVDVVSPVSTAQQWLGVPCSVAVEMAGLALVWYAAAVGARVKWWLLVAIGFAVAGLLIPTNTFWVLAYIPFIAALLALAVSQFTDRVWAAPVYTVAFLAAVMMGHAGSLGTHNEAVLASWLLLGFAALTYIIGVIEDFPLFLWLTPFSAIWAVYAAATLGDLYRLPVVALASAAIGVGIGNLPRISTVFVSQRGTLLRFSLPLYATAIGAAVLTGVYGTLTGVNYPFPTAIPDALLLYAAVACAILVCERQIRWLWVVAIFGIWGMVLATQTNVLYLVCAGLVTGLVGLVVNSAAKRLAAPASMVERVRSHGSVFTDWWGWPWYATALTAVIATAVYSLTTFTPNYPFYAALPLAFLLYALLTYSILVFEQKSTWLWLVAACVTFATILLLRASTCVASCDGQIQTVSYLLLSIALATGIGGLVAGRLFPARNGVPISAYSTFTWSWPWYAASLLTMLVTLLWNYIEGGTQLSGVLAYGSISAFVALSLIVALVERRLALLAVPVAFVAWGIVQTHGLLWQQLLAFSILFFCITLVQYVWRVVSLNTRNVPSNALRTALGLIGQALVLLVSIAYGGLVAASGPLAQVGVGAVVALAIQLFLYGRMQSNAQTAAVGQQHWTLYGAGLLIALAITWELDALHQTHIEWLTLAPATYLIVVAPFLSRDERVINHQRVGQLCSILGSVLLLLPTLWSSFSQVNIQPTFILAGEALVLLLLGIGLRVRFFVLSGAALVIVSAMHALFLPSLGLPPSLALTVMGVTLLGLATALSLARHRLQAVWTQLE